MRIHRLSAVLLVIPALFAQTADLAVTNARVYTVNPKQPVASALAVRQGRIVAVSDNISKLIGPSTKVIDAHGGTVVPGLIDSHGHMLSLGAALETLDLRGVTSEQEIADKVRAAARNLKPGEWIQGRAWDQNLWATKQFPSSASLSAAAPANPVALSRVDGHAVWANARAMELADVTTATVDPPGGKILKGADGRPSGVFLDNAQGLIQSKIPPDSPAQIERRLRLAMKECARFGLTAVDDAGVGKGEVEAYRKLARQGEMPIRVYAMIYGPGPYMDDWLKRTPEFGSYGALGSRGASLLEPCDAANRMVLESYAAALKGTNDKRFRVEHAQIIAPSDFATFAKYSILVSMQPTHATSDMPWAADRLGPERVKGAYAWQTLLHLGVHVPAGSDFPVESPNPLWGFHAAVTRQDKDNHPDAGWFPEQRMSREEALRAFTIEGAYAAFAEKDRGSLENGKLADFVILSDDIMTIPVERLRNVHVTKTVVGGRIVFSE